MVADNPKYGNVKDGYARWREYMNEFGLGIRLGIDLPSEDKGNIPDTSVYNKDYRNVWNSCTNLTLGIGQDKMTSTPLQLANAMCLIANKGYYYTPHFVKNIDGETKEDTILNRFRQRHNVLTDISDEAFEAVMSGMQDVVERGTATGARIPGINICAKTGTAQNFIIMDGRKLELNENAMFVCFAPRENPKIVLAVVVENAGYGSTSAAPIASLLIEKFLNDTLRPESIKRIDELSNKNLMPSHLPRLQYKADSARGFRWFQITNDSNYIKKYLNRSSPKPAKKDSSAPIQRIVYRQDQGIIEPKKVHIMKKKTIA
jgi:penicillin-binding protein 2